jgi:hypothetical protein
VDAKHKGVTFKCEDCGKEGFSTNTIMLQGQMQGGLQGLALQMA